jgi:hypothetical protein
MLCMDVIAIFLRILNKHKCIVYSERIIYEYECMNLICSLYVNYIIMYNKTTRVV